ncbi:hypothetical protein BJ741DRAFT_602891 [Chytriomyces cf. hyalinus JEL632]|nr:hypothetical protein BJ741DRAFT_602891 [Chytriomyces cf. hyalinus JEL632]
MTKNARNLVKILEQPMRIFNTADLVAIGVNILAATSSVVELGHLLYFIILVEQRVSKDKPTNFPWFNISLLALGLGLLALHTSSTVCIFERSNPFDAVIETTVVNLSFSVCELMYIWYTWLRSKAILKLKGALRYRMAAAVVAIAPVIYSTQFIILCVHLYWSDEHRKRYTIIAFNLASAIGGLAVISFDCIMLHSFTTFLHENEIEHDSSQTGRRIGTSKRFSVIATYGRASCILLLGALALYIALSVVGYRSGFGYVLQALCHAVVHGAFSLLVGMKVALHLCDLKEEQADSLIRNGGDTESAVFISVSAPSWGGILIGSPKSDLTSVRRSDGKVEKSRSSDRSSRQENVNLTTSTNVHSERSSQAISKSHPVFAT